MNRLVERDELQIIFDQKRCPIRKFPQKPLEGWGTSRQYGRADKLVRIAVMMSKAHFAVLDFCAPRLTQTITPPISPDRGSGPPPAPQGDPVE